MLNINEKELSTKERFEKIVRSGNLLYPDEQVVRFIMKNRKQGDRFLDFGCGAGRHCIAAAKAGYDVLGIDYSEGSLSKAKENVDKEKKIYEFLNIDLLVMDIRNDNEIYEKLKKKDKYNKILAWGAMFFQTKDQCVEVLKRLNSLLEDNGEFYADYRTKEDYLYLYALENSYNLEENCYFLNTDESHDKLIYYFMDKETLYEVYEKAGFKIISIEDYKFTRENGTQMNSWYQVLAKKK